MALVTNYSVFDILFLIFLLTFGIYVYFTRNFNYWKSRGVKEVTPSFFFGNVARCIFAFKNPQQLIMELYQKFKDEKMVGFYVLEKPFVILRDPELIRDVFIKDFNNFTNKLITGNYNDSLGSKSLFLVRNPPWKYIRQKMTPVFTSGKLKKMFELMPEICDDLENYLEDYKIDDKYGQVIEVKEICAKFTTDLIGTTAFGIKFNSLTNPEAEFRKYGKLLFRSTYKRYLEMMSIFLVPHLRFLMKPKFFDDKGSEFLRNAFFHVIAERTRTGIKRNDLIDILIDIKKMQENDDPDKYKLEGEDFVAQAAIFFTGGFETSSTTMYFALYELSKNIEVQTKLREEILNATEMTGGKLTYDLITGLPYLDMVLQETLRMYPILGYLDRVPENDYTFAGTDVTITKDTPVILPVRAMHMNPKYFPDPEKFNPERFSKENKPNIVPFTYFPFGEGPRNCIGARLGAIQVKLGILIFVRNYELTPAEGTPIPMQLETLNLFTHSHGKMPLNLRRI